eukprot:10326723-Ditylum_brightwellii.AAC.1
MVDMELEVKEERLPRVWLTSTELPWDPSMLGEDNNIIVTLCWNGESEFLEASDSNMQDQEEINQFENYIL